jgi:hypothetical protein
MTSQEFGILVKKYQMRGMSYNEAKKKVEYDMKGMNQLKYKQKYEQEREKAQGQAITEQNKEKQKNLVKGLSQ